MSKLQDISIVVSPNNRKLGKIANISTVPVADCGNCEGCGIITHEDGSKSFGPCYARKAYKQYPNVRKAWKKNSQAFRKNRTQAFIDLSAWFDSKKTPPRFFRIHVAGDFLDQDHVNQWSQFCTDHPDTKFLAFTKMHDLDYSSIASNLSVVLSMWTGLDIPQSDLPLAWVNDGQESRIPSDAIECPGICEHCGMCWELQKIGRDVYFNLH